MMVYSTEFDDADGDDKNQYCPECGELLERYSNEEDDPGHVCDQVLLEENPDDD